MEWFLRREKQSMALMEHGLQISLKRYACFMKDKMAAGGLGRATNYGGDCVICLQIPECISLQSLLCRFVSRTSDSSQKKKKILNTIACLKALW